MKTISLGGTSSIVWKIHFFLIIFFVSTALFIQREKKTTLSNKIVKHNIKHHKTHYLCRFLEMSIKFMVKQKVSVFRAIWNCFKEAVLV